jgi:hypothetical protein
LVTYDLRPEVDAISYERNGRIIGKEKNMFKDVTQGNTKNIYFGLSGAFIS